MADRYTYKNQKLVHVAPGDHGLDLRADGPSATILRSMPVDEGYDAQFEVQTGIQLDSQLIVLRKNPNSGDLASFHTRTFVEFINCGHSHCYSASDYPQIAPEWRNRLLEEGRYLQRSIEGDQKEAHELESGFGIVIAAGARFASLFTG